MPWVGSGGRWQPARGRGETKKRTTPQSGASSTFLLPPIPHSEGNLWALLADATQAHATILLLTYAAIPFIRYGLTAVSGYGPTLALVLAMEAVGAPVNIIVDASTMAAGEDEGAYGRTRVWGAVGWGLFSPVGGWIVARYGLKAAFAANCGAWGAGVVLTALLPVSALSSTHAGARAQRAARRRAAAAAADAARAERSGRATPPPAGLAAAGRQPRSPRPPAAPLPAAACPASATPDADAVSAHLSTSLPLAIAPELQAYDSDALLVRKAAARKASAEEAALGEDAEGGGNPLARPLLLDSRPPQPPSPPTDHAAAAAEAAAAAALPIPAKLARILATPGAAPFFATCAVFGFAMGTIDSWLFVFLESLGAPPTLMGLTLTVTCIVEAPVFFFAGRLLAAIGTKAVLRLVYVAFLARLSAYWALPLLGTPWAVLPVEALHGITFGCAWAAGTAQCARLAPPGLEATTQAVFTVREREKKKKKKGMERAEHRGGGGESGPGLGGRGRRDNQTSALTSLPLSSFYRASTWASAWAWAASSAATSTRPWAPGPCLRSRRAWSRLPGR